MRLNARTDHNQAEIIKQLRKCGATVESLHRVGGGCPDLMVGCFGVNTLLEIKNPDTKGKLNKKQVVWHNKWKGQRAVVSSPVEALKVVGIL